MGSDYDDKLVNNPINHSLQPCIENTRYEKVYLTQRQRDILKMIAQGKSNQEISQQHGISQHAVKRHIMLQTLIKPLS